MKKRILSLLLCLLFALGAALPASAELVSKAPAPKSIKLNAKARTILPGGFFKLNATIKPSNASKGVTWESSDELIASVSANGLVTANAEGSCTITATTANGVRSASCAITVRYAYGNTKVRFFGVANSSYLHKPLDSPGNDLRYLMNDVYSDARFQGAKAKKYMKYNLGGNGIRNLLKGMSSKYNIKKTDVTIFYYSGHGAESNQQAYRGALVGVDADRVRGDAPYVRVDEIRKYLDKVPGTVIVILDSCLSGQFVESKALGKKAAASSAGTKAFTDAWVSSLSQSKATNYVVNKSLTSSAKSYKYKILAACASMENSYLAEFGTGDGRGMDISFLTLAFCSGAVPYVENGAYVMDADLNADRQVSLAEAYQYCVPRVNEWIGQLNEYFGENNTQTVTAWPMDDPFPLSSFT